MFHTTTELYGLIIHGNQGGDNRRKSDLLLQKCCFLGKKNTAGTDFGELSRAVACPTNLILFILMNLVGIR